VRNQAVKSLGLCCLRSVDLARERIVLLLQVTLTLSLHKYQVNFVRSVYAAHVVLTVLSWTGPFINGLEACTLHGW